MEFAPLFRFAWAPLRAAVSHARAASISGAAIHRLTACFTLESPLAERQLATIIPPFTSLNTYRFDPVCSRRKGAMAAMFDWMLAGARRLGTFAGKNCRPKTLFSLAVALSAIGGCRNDLSRQNMDSDRFLDQYAAGRGLTRDQARREIESKMNDQETQQVMHNAENVGVKNR
ncbi:MAG TPA: hypothetical protein VHB99_12595 [Pirellulales bacterium]|nr:hypothetical protein [Pirellulales bacterium]